MKIAMKCINMIAFLAMITINVLANALPLGGNTTGDISSSSPTLFTPAPITFSIWGLIYLFMGLFAFFQLFTATNGDQFDKIYSHIGPWFVVSCIMNIAWIFSWHYQKIGLSLIFMLGLLVSLIFINMSYTIGPEVNIFERLSVYGFNIYIGWICAATIANVGVFLARINWSRFGLSEQFWTIVVIVVGMLLGLAFTAYGHRFMATFAIIWAYCGILIKHISVNGYGNSYPLIIVITACSVLAMLSMIVVTWIMPETMLLKEY